MDTSSILKQLIELDDEVTSGKPAAREQMLIAAQALVTSLQTPSEFIACIGWAEPARWACVRTALDLKIFDILKDAGDRGANLTELSNPTASDVGLVTRIMRHLAAMNVVSQKSQDVYVNNALSSQLTEPKYKSGILFTYDVIGKSLYAVPPFLSKIGYKEPLDIINSPLQFAFGTKSHIFSWLNQNPTYQEAFASWMSGYRQGKRLWFSPDFYPLQTQLAEGFNPTLGPKQNAPFLVDVGGGKGHDLLALLTQFPKLPGRLVLEDKAEMIALIGPPLPADIETIAHDFFTSQPESCSGARAYFLHSVLHDWDDESCIKILQALKPGMIPGYSKALVHDLLIPDRGAAWSVTSMDWVMLAACSAKERTEMDFRRLFDAAGLVIEKTWMYEQGTEVVIEASLPART